MDGGLHHFGLVDDLDDVDADRAVAREVGHTTVNVLAEREIVAARGHRERQADGRLAVDPVERRRRVHVPPADVGNIGETEEAAVGPQIDAREVGLGGKAAADP